jgi:hypothetical protein
MVNGETLVCGDLLPTANQIGAPNIVEKQNPTAVAMAFGACFRTVRKWVKRAEIEAGPLDS